VKQHVPLEKQSKKRQRAYYAARRGSWNGVCPVTKTVESKKVYNRKRAKRRWEPDALPDFHFFGKQTPSSSSRKAFRRTPPA